MRVRILTLIMLVSVAVFQPRLALAEDSPTLAQRWTQFTTVVKETVTDLWNKWMGGDPAQPNQPERAVAAAPAGIPVQEPAATAVNPAPPAPVVTSVTSQAPAVSQAPVSPAPVVNHGPAEEIKQIRQNIKAKQPFTIKSEGRAHGASLKTAKSGVPLYDFLQLKKVKSVPALDVGVESEISRQDFSLPDWDWKIKQLQSVEQHPSPAPLTAKESGEAAEMVLKAQSAKVTPADKSALDGSVTHEKIEKIDWKVRDVSEVELKPFEAMSEDAVKMLVTRILFAKGDRCHLVLGLADELGGKGEFKNEALFEVGACAKQLKMNQIAFDKLSDVLRKQDPEFGPKAIALLAIDLPPVFEEAFYEIVRALEGKEGYFSDKRVKDEIFYRTAKGAFKAGQYKVAEKWATRVDPSSSFGPYAQYVIGISQFGMKEKAQARATLESLARTVDRTGDNVLKGLVDVDLARMDFVAHKYTEALPLYLKVPKDHPLWVQALVEQGWAQLATEDYAGAIGNMYSLHSPYFKVLYQPQSFVVRTVGYLNICQFGDAYRTLTKLETDYRDWQSRLTGYLRPERTPASVYDTVKAYLRGKSNVDIEGLPYQIIREAARAKDFLNLQDAINAKSDEMALFAGVTEKIKKDKDGVRIRAEQAKKKAAALAVKIAAAEKAHLPAQQIASLKKDMERERIRSVPNHFELAILEQSQQAFVRFQKASQTRIVDSQHLLAGKASKVLIDRMKVMRTEIARVLENNEFLRYEIFAGSGENIRFQVAGGQVSGDNRLPASVKPQKMMNWSFDGEFWEDEIGNYRSSLRNNCPKTPTKSGEQANRGE